MKAPGYNSKRWINQDWRYLAFIREKDLFGNVTERISYSKKCGAKGNRTEKGKVRLCLPKDVIVSLMRSKRGQQELRKQMIKKLNSKTKRTKYNDFINKKMRDFQMKDTFKDDPKKRKR